MNLNELDDLTLTDPTSGLLDETQIADNILRQVAEAMCLVGEAGHEWGLYSELAGQRLRDLLAKEESK